MFDNDPSIRQKLHPTKAIQQITLDNDLQCIVVEDSCARFATLGIHIDCESMYNDITDIHSNVNGLQHLYEHMLLQGSKHFKQAESIINVCRELGGSFNASSMETAIQLQCRTNASQIHHLYPLIVDALLQPLHDINAIKQQIAIIDREFSEKKTDWASKINQVMRHCCQQIAVENKFLTGNLQSFSKITVQQLQQQLKAFSKLVARSSNITICLVCPPHHNVDYKALFTPFSTIPKGKVRSFVQARQSADTAPAEAIAIDEANNHQLIINFTLPEIYSHYRNKPLALTAHLMEQQNSGGLVAKLKQQHWVNSLNARVNSANRNITEFSIFIQLTELGQVHRNAVLQKVLGFIGYLQKTPLELWRFDELQQIYQLRYDKMLSHSVEHLATEFAENTALYGPRDVLSANHLLHDIDHNKELAWCRKLNASTMRIFYTETLVTTTKREPWYGTQYQHKDFADALSPKSTSWELPLKNPFLNASSSSAQSKITESRHNTLVSKGDYYSSTICLSGQLVGIGECYLGFYGRYANQNTVAKVKTDLVVNLFNHRLKQQFAQATQAGILLRCYASLSGLSFHGSGEITGLSKLVIALLEDFQQLLITPALFKQVSNQLRARYQQQSQVSAIDRLFQKLSCEMEPLHYDVSDKTHCLSTIQPSDLIAFKQQFLSRLNLKTLYAGDWCEQQLRPMIEGISTITQRNGQKAEVITPRPSNRVVQTGQQWLVPGLTESATMSYLFVTEYSIEQVAHLMLTEQLLAPLLHQTLRNQDLLCYRSGCHFLASGNAIGLVLYGQCEPNKLIKLQAHITDYIARLKQADINVIEGSFEITKSHLAAQLENPQQHLSQQYRSAWLQQFNGPLSAYSDPMLATQVQAITLADYQDFLTSLNKQAKVRQLTFKANN